MSAVPQGAFMALKLRQYSKSKTSKKLHDNYQEDNRELAPFQYNSKMMNSIWGLYNRYSVHNLKKNYDKNVTFNAVNVQLEAVRSTAVDGTNGTMPHTVLTKSWDNLLALGGTY